MNIVFNDIFTEIAALLFLASIFGFIFIKLKQPLIVAFIALGIFVGPSETAGAQMDLSQMGQQLFLASILSLIVLVGNPLIVMAIIGLLGYQKKTGFLAGMTVAQISEFSLILGALGVKLGHISPDILSTITLVAVITISISTYMINYSHQMYEKLAPWLTIFELKITHKEPR